MAMAADDGPDTAARVRVLLQVNRSEEALKLLGQALGAHPDDVTLHCLRAQALLKLGRHAEGKQAAERAVSTDPTSEWAHRLRAAAILDQRRPKNPIARKQAAADARLSCLEAVRLASWNPSCYVLLARAEALAGEPLKAGAAIDRAVELSPNSFETWVSYSQVALMLKDFKGAEDAARRAIALNPSSYAAHNNLGAALLGQQNRQQAAACFATAARLNPPSSVVQRNLVNTGLRLPRLALMGLMLPLLAVPGGAVFFFALAVVGPRMLAKEPRVRDWAMRRGMRLAARKPVNVKPVEHEQPRLSARPRVGRRGAYVFVVIVSGTLAAAYLLAAAFGGDQDPRLAFLVFSLSMGGLSYGALRRMRRHYPR
jgi:Flp pilus assembly protein TadD